ncbi:polysaccharide deacetylase family protein, partial [bacterium]|nr:polysaccharide deacetylase family protein [bacterium]
MIGAIFILSLTDEIPSSNPKKTKPGHIVHTIIIHGVSLDPTVQGFSVSPDYLRDVFRMIQISGKKTLFASEAANMIYFNEKKNQEFVCLTFDDGEKGLLEYVDPLLEEFGFKANAFVFTSGTNEGKRHHNWQELQQLQATGRWQIQSHSHVHRHLTQMTDAEAEVDLETSLMLLHEHNLSIYPILAYPFGEYDDRIATIAKRIGFKAAFTAGPNGRSDRDSDQYAIPRTTVAQLFDQELVCRKLGLDEDPIKDEIQIFNLKEEQTHRKGLTPNPRAAAAIVDTIT